MASGVPVERINAVRPFFALQLPALVLPKAAIHKSRLVDNLSDLAPRVPREVALPRTAETLKLERLSQPALNVLQLAVECRVAFRRVSARSRCSGKRGACLVLRTPDIRDARGQCRYVSACRWRLNGSRLRSFSLRSTHGTTVLA